MIGPPMISDALEFSISQYADGTLPDGERLAVEAALSADPAARAVLADYRRLGDLLLAPPADLDWDRLHRHLSSAVAEGDRPAVAGRIGFGMWRLGAIAAAAVVAVAVGIMAHGGRPTPVAVVPTPAPAVQVAEVTGPTVEAAAGPVVSQVTVGPSPALAARGSSWRYAEGVVSRQPTVVIARAQALPGHD